MTIHTRAYPLHTGRLKKLKVCCLHDIRLIEKGKHINLNYEYSEFSEMRQPFMFGESFMCMHLSSHRSPPDLLDN